MKEISLNVENYNELLFHYPCINPIGKYLENKIVWVLNDNESNTKYLRSIVEAGAKIENILEIDLLCSVFTPEIAIVFPPKQLTDNVPSGDTQEEYYRIMEHYIHFSQMMVHRMSDQPTTFNHLLFVLPPYADEYSCELDRMAYYAITGLVAGLGKMYAPRSIFVNSVILNDNLDIFLVSDWIAYLVSDNSNNIVGQNIKL